MKALFNCSAIKNVYLRTDMSHVELEITYLDTDNKNWLARKTISDSAHKDYQIQKYTHQYEKIKEALLNKKPFVEIEL